MSVWRRMAFTGSQGATPANMPSEAVMRIGSVIIVVWLIIGAIAAGQRHYYSSADPNCARAGTIIVTVLAGPLNYTGVNPKITCKIPQPSK
jgi:membrane protein YdbS with pleckstrin-like domain